MAGNPQILEVWGDLACFTRPELKVERFSYPCITPSAARGVFDAIYAKPVEFRWQIRRIELLEKPAFLALRRNEVKEKINVTAVSAWMEGKREPEPIWADGDRELVGTDEKGRTQRQTMALRNVHYRLTAEIVPWPGHAGKQAALEAQFRRRAEKGKCFYQPAMGCREFPAFFELVDPAAGGSIKPPVDFDLDIGLMLYDVFDLSRPGTSSDRPAVSLFRAAIERGVLEVPAWGSAAVLRSGGEG
ncbi:MAG TPA: type I-C CRISPR-associated protein Cas5c [Thermoanaerobaculia bacterium]|jgi:CRISPR-associated protein Cas5d|nr:type I-C CRISPR-associated protein Cas5c [Thermoanaerobaculia bacterium]